MEKEIFKIHHDRNGDEQKLFIYFFCGVHFSIFMPIVNFLEGM